MAAGGVQLTGLPYVPGQARGVLCRGWDTDVADRIVILKQAELGPLTSLPAGFILIDVAPFSHALIPLLASGVPTVIVDAAQAVALHDGLEVALDGSRGLITADTTGLELRAPPARGTTNITVDATEVQLRVSVRDAAAARRAAAAEAQAIGLVRTEFLLPADGGIPDTDFYRREFRALCEAAAPLPVTFRLIDIASDKHPAWLPLPADQTGTLGLQGVRLFDQEPVRGVYRAQLTAIDNLAGEFDLRVLLPYVSNEDELRVWAERIHGELAASIPLGAMAETPAAALQIADWLATVDFVAVGCNDLMQCLFGADRDRPELRGYLDPYAPSLYRFLRQAADSASDNLHRVQLCGVLPQLPGILPLLLGLGYRAFSVEAASLDHMRRTIAATSMDTARSLAAKVCAARRSSADVRESIYQQESSAAC